MMTSSLKSIKELSQELCSGRIQSRNLVNEALAKIEDKDGEGIRTMLKVHAELARATADNFDSSRKLNIAISPIAGLPITVKDLFDIEYWELEQAKLNNNNRPLDFQGKIAIVTGAASGIGKACVKSLIN